MGLSVEEWMLVSFASAVLKFSGMIAFYDCMNNNIVIIIIVIFL